MGNKTENLEAVYGAVVHFMATHGGNMGTLKDVRDLLEELTGIALTTQYVHVLVKELVEAERLVKVDGYICHPGYTWTPGETTSPQKEQTSDT